jgi:hypothetical protein
MCIFLSFEASPDLLLKYPDHSLGLPVIMLATSWDEMPLNTPFSCPLSDSFKFPSAYLL